jgi:signal transduction histidine kinase/DNA-binding response OmpR family regulator/CHASE3 domain sensor protein
MPPPPAGTTEETAESAELSRRLTIALVTPVALLLVVGIALGFQLVRMASDAQWVDHTDEVVATTAELEKQIIDQETSLRGFLVTDDRLFLEAFLKASPREGVARLRILVSDNPVEVANIDDLARRYEYWLTQTAFVVQGGPTGPSRTIAAMREGKREMDDIRAAASAILATERRLRHERTLAAAASASLTKGIFVAFFVGAAAVLAFLSRAQLAAIARTFRAALDREQAARETLQQQDWVRTGQVKVSEALRGDLSLAELGNRALQTLASYVHADIGAFFTSDGRGWRRRAGYALDSRSAGPESFTAGEGVVGAAAASVEIVHLRDVPSDFFKLRSGTGEHLPAEVVVVPARVDDTALAVMELGFFAPIDARTKDLLGRVGEGVAMAVRSTEYQARLRDLLEESQRQAEELQAQQEELRVSNEELEEQTNAVRAAQGESEQRQRLLEEMNTRLEEQTTTLQRTQLEVTLKATEVERASRYKSEFLANMSHELRTPLNSSLILAKLLADNKEGNLTVEQVKFAETISSAGNDLLILINDILDLSKIEAGKVELNVAATSLRHLANGLTRVFEPVAEQKKLAFTVLVDEDAPATIETDSQRLEQVLKNLLANALKFTDKGEVSLQISADGAGVRFLVRDTGIGIAPDQLGLIFDAFRQADGASNRRYGGTGLGLSISRDLTALLGGEIHVVSEIGKGSTFTLTLPAASPSPAAQPEAAPLAQLPRQPQRVHVAPALEPSAGPVSTLTPGPAFEDDRGQLDGRRRLVLVIEDDVVFAKLVFDLAHEAQFQCIVAHEAETGFALAKKYTPSAIVLDVRLPDHSGLSILDRLKHDPGVRHVPVHVMSAGDHSQAALSMGAVGYMMKPVKRDELVRAFERFEERLSRRMRRLLIVEDDAVQRDSMTRLLAGPDIEITAVGTVSLGLSALKAGNIDCVVTDLTLSDASGFDLLEQMANDDSYSFPPVIVYTGRSLTQAEEQRLRRHSSSIIVKGARSPERLLDEVALFLHQVESELPPERRRMLEKARDREAIFDGRHILIVEDDVRNVFALTSILESKGMKVSIARNGREALTELDRVLKVDLILMDVMMPEMDGIEATKRIRARPEWSKLPIIALTAKAMKDDRERCLAAGVNDYIAKPLDVEMLLSLLRVWMPR